MEITIDTTKDSKEDIKKAIKFLKHIIGEESESGSQGAPPQTFDSMPGATDAMSMFSEGTSGSTQPTPASAVDLLGNAITQHHNSKDDKKMPKMDPDKITIIPY